MVIIIITIILVPIQTILHLLKIRASYLLPMLYHRILLKLFDIKITVKGEINDQPGLIVSNHGSWVDIFLISSVLRTVFVAKKDVSTWPFISFLARLQKTIFIDRNNPKKLMKTVKDIEKRILKNEKIVIFPEGTSSDGNKILPFKSSIFILCDLIKEKNATIQPISIAYTKYNGLAIDRISRPLIAWYGNMNLLSHLYFMIKSGSFDVEITFHNKIDISEKKSRKEIANECEKQIRRGFLSSLKRGI
ncbi:MAG: lysophospholipid acyltransferase family protein [Hyphomicrobiales bacterium]|nr:lysophospholipid acyltransferase family protein [Hyphomicrobiales bacterium]|tara:strand:+ start:1375 stop:2118 length:744 start_codon:yes stop_codon:yes gene_type:complete